MPKIKIGTHGNDRLTGQFVFGKHGDDTLLGRDDIFSFLFGGRGHDALQAGDVGGYLVGGRGPDTLLGGVGDDTLKGGRGNDTLTSFDGYDFLKGGKGSDWFVFHFDDIGVDTVADFKHGKDKLIFFSKGGPALPLEEAQFHIGTAATTDEQRLIYDDTTGQLYYDSDGIGGASQVLIAILKGTPAIQPDDILANFT